MVQKQGLLVPDGPVLIRFLLLPDIGREATAIDPSTRSVLDELTIYKASLGCLRTRPACGQQSSAAMAVYKHQLVSQGS